MASAASSLRNERATSVGGRGQIREGAVAGVSFRTRGVSIDREVRRTRARSEEGRASEPKDDRSGGLEGETSEVVRRALFHEGDEAEPPVLLRLVVERDVHVLQVAEGHERGVEHRLGDLLVEPAWGERGRGGGRGRSFVGRGMPTTGGMGGEGIDRSDPRVGSFGRSRSGIRARVREARARTHRRRAWSSAAPSRRARRTDGSHGRRISPWEEAPRGGSIHFSSDARRAPSTNAP